MRAGWSWGAEDTGGIRTPAMAVKWNMIYGNNLAGWARELPGRWLVRQVLCPEFNHQRGKDSVDLILIIAIILLLVGGLGVGGVIGALGNLAWFLIVLAVIVIAWRVITGRRAV